MLIVILAASLRIFDLGKNPPGLYWDEVSLGWNAYSILKTGMDEHGRFFPVDAFYAFGDYKPPGYIYATVPSIALFGLNEFSIRFPSALSGIGLVLVTYFLVKELFPTTKPFNHLAIFSTFFVAISPWSVTLSRVAFESNLATFFNALGVLFFVCALKRSPKWIILSVSFFLLSAYTFNANRVLAPLFLSILSLLNFRYIKKRWKWWLLSAIFGFVMTLPMVAHLRSPQGKLRWDEVNIFSDLSVIEISNIRKEIDHGSLVSKLFHHRYLGYMRLFLKHYFDHFSLNYLFLDGDPNPRINIPGTGELYLMELPFFLIGVALLLGSTKSFIWQNARWIVLSWILLAPIPASLARETPHALRSASALPIPHILSALGAVWMVNTIRYKRLFYIVYCFLLIASLGFSQLVYYRYYPYEWSQEWLTSYPRLVRYIDSIKEQNQLIYITPDLGRPYIYFLFYSHYSPEKFIQDAVSGGRSGDAFGFFSVNSFGPYRFYIPDLTTVTSKDVMVTRADPPPDGFSLLQTITDSNGKPEFNVVKR